jgi:flavin reductase (DIM6/NTAB) family NADH-FMN oxidoreductase RutF
MALARARKATIEPGAFRQVMGRFVTGITVVTAATAEGPAAGLTVNSFTSVSLNPPLVLVCVDLTSQLLPTLHASGHFAVNILAGEQEALARCFASRTAERYEQFCHALYHSGTTGSPILVGALASIEARIIAEYPGGDHVIFLGEVVALGTDDGENGASDEGRSGAPGEAGERCPLVFYHSRYRRLA